MASVEEEQEGGIPEWVVTFGDMMSLLLTFFVLLFSMSEIKQDQSVALIESLQRQFGNATANLSLMAGRFPATTTPANRLPSLGRAKRRDTMKGGDTVRAPVGDHPRVMAIRPADDSTQGGVIYFEEGSSQLTEEQRRTVQAIARTVGGKPQKIEIRGHTSSRPLDPNSPYRSHFDLAYARCFKVMELLVDLGVNSKRILIEAAGANEPIHTGYDELLRKKNSRVEVSLVNDLAEDLKGTEDSNEKRPNAEEMP